MLCSQVNIIVCVKRLSFFPLSGCCNKLICFQLSCPSSPLQSAHSELCHWARWQQGLMSGERRSDFWQPDWSVWPIGPLQWISAGWAPTRKSLPSFKVTGHVRIKCVSLKWPIRGCRLKDRLAGLASATLLPPPLLACSAACQPSFWLFTCGLNMQHVSRRAADIPHTSQRWMKSCVKLPLWREWINKFEGLIPWRCSISWVWLHNAGLNVPSAPLRSLLCSVALLIP